MMCVPDFLQRLGTALHQQDNAATADPLYIVQVLETRALWPGEDADGFVGYDADGEFIGVYTYDEADHIERGDFDEDEEPPAELVKCCWEWAPIAGASFLTRKAAERFIVRQRHNYRNGLRLYVASGHNNPELQALRRALLALAPETSQASAGPTAGLPHTAAKAAGGTPKLGFPQGGPCSEGETLGDHADLEGKADRNAPPEAASLVRGARKAVSASGGAPVTEEGLP